MLQILKLKLPNFTTSFRGHDKGFYLFRSWLRENLLKCAIIKKTFFIFFRRN